MGPPLQVAPEGITIRAPARAGLFYGIQSLLQLLPAERRTDPGGGVSLPALLVSRAPEVQGIESGTFESSCWVRSTAQGLVPGALDFKR